MHIIKPWLLALAIPVLYAVLARLLFNGTVFNLPDVMGFSFLLGVPYAMGHLTVILSQPKWVQSGNYCIFSPWIPVFVFMALTMLLHQEGTACWIMILPLWMTVSSIAGYIAGLRIRRKKEEEDAQKLLGSWVLFLPFLFAPLEKLITFLPARYEAYTYRDIQAPAEKIWGNVVRVRTISEQEEHGYLTRILGFPRPIRAELNYAGVGGSRQAIFSKGLVFEEIVREYEEQKKMRFSIKADPHSIPPTAMDEHVVIGGQYFDVLDGTYRLEKLSDRVYRLHLYSHFVLRTHFNFYASWWAGWIMTDIQNNILQVIQTRCQENL